MASSAEAIASVAPQVTVISVSGFTVMPYQSAYFCASGVAQALGAPGDGVLVDVVADRPGGGFLQDLGAGKLGNPCARLMASCSAARRVMPRMTDSVKPVGAAGGVHASSKWRRETASQVPSQRRHNGWLDAPPGERSIEDRMTRSAVRIVRGVTALAALGLLATCQNETAGPGRRAALAVTPVLPAGANLAAVNLTIDAARLIVVSSAADTAFDQTFPFPANQTSLRIRPTSPWISPRRRSR